MVFSGGGSTQLSLQQFNGGDGQIFVSSGSTALNIGSNASTVSTPIRFFTSTGSSALGLERARITGEGNFGIATIAPSETLDVGTGNVRVRQINSNSSTNANDKIVVADSNGVLKTKSLFVPYTALTGFRNTASSNLSSGFRIITMDSNPLIAGLTYDAGTGQYTVAANSAGYYQIAATISTDVSTATTGNNPTGGTAIFRLRVNGNPVNTVTTGYLDGSTATSQNMVYVVYLSVGDVIDIQNYYTRVHRITGAQISAIKLSN